MANLYELMGHYAELQSLAGSGDATEEQMAAALELLDDSKGDLKAKVDGICRILKNLGGSITALKAEEKRLAARRKARENNVERLRSWVFLSMKVLDVDQIKTDAFTVSIVKGQPKVLIHHEDKIPEEFLKDVRPPPDLKKILLAFQEDGETVPGTEVVRMEGLQVR